MHNLVINGVHVPGHEKHKIKLDEVLQIVVSKQNKKKSQVDFTFFLKILINLGHKLKYIKTVVTSTHSLHIHMFVLTFS